MEYTYISPSAGIDALCPHTLPCECGSGSNLRGDGHASYCQLLGESKYEPEAALSPVAELASGKQWYIQGPVVKDYCTNLRISGEFISFHNSLYTAGMSGMVLGNSGPGAPVWVTLEPNQYLIVRHPIKDDRRDYLNKLYTLHGEEVCD